MNCVNHPDRERIAFCQNCGKPLCQECARTIGSAVFCEPCLAEKLSSAAPTSTYTATYQETAPPLTGSPSPVLATLLGFLPGVGAMYNGQYAKGIVHLIVFAILVTLTNQSESGIFGLFVAGWMIYQAIEANHTAKARLAGTPLPNPFGLNDLGERLGFGKAWPTPVSAPPSAASDASSTAYPPPASHWGAPPETYAYPPPPPAAAYAAVPPAEDFAPHHPHSRFPTGAVWLIGLGVFLLLANTGLFHVFAIARSLPLLLIAFGVWLFVHKMSESGTRLDDDGTPLYRVRLFRAMRGPVWLILLGMLLLLNNFNILRWGRSWPLLLIVGGLLAFFERTALNDASAPPFYPGASPVPPAPDARVSFVPEAAAPEADTRTAHDGEGN